MSEVIVGEVEEIGFPGVACAGPGVDRDPEPLPAPFEQDVIVRSLAPGLRLPVDDFAAEDAVAPVCHAALPGTKDDRRAKINRVAAILPYSREVGVSRRRLATVPAPSAPAPRHEPRSRRGG